MLPDYHHAFTHLHTATNRTHWSAATRHRAPNKPLLLLTVIDLFAQGLLTANLIEPGDDLADLFGLYWALVMPLDRRGNLAMPFFHLRSEGFWHLVPRPGQEAALTAVKSISALSQLHELLLGARLDDDLYTLLRTIEGREQLRAALIDTYFVPELHAPLHAQAATNQAAFQYSLTLVEEAKSGKRLQELLIPYTTIPPIVRDQGFRRAVVTAYTHRCAFCSIRMRTPDGHTVVDAAHIIPWSVSHNDDPRNGLALCRLCHWTFDEGLLGVSHRYQVIATKALTAYGNIAGHLLTLHERPIFQPLETALWPAHDALRWHREQCLRR